LSVSTLLLSVANAYAIVEGLQATVSEGGENPLALTRERKQALLREYSDRIARAQVMIWADYRGLRVSQMEQLRGQLRPLGAELMVIKNTLMRLALEQVNLPTDPDVMGGPSAVAFAYDDVGAASKVVTDFARVNEGLFRIRGGLAGGKLVDNGQVRLLSNLPPREVMLAFAIAGIQAPISGFVGALAAMIRSLLHALSARQRQLEGA